MKRVSGVKRGVNKVRRKKGEGAMQWIYSVLRVALENYCYLCGCFVHFYGGLEEENGYWLLGQFFINMSVRILLAWEIYKILLEDI